MRGASVCVGVDAKEFRLAQMCASNIIIYMDHLQDLIHHYEVDGHFKEIIAVLEQGVCRVCALPPSPALLAVFCLAGISMMISVCRCTFDALTLVFHHFFSL